ADTDADPDLDANTDFELANADFELIFLEAISMFLIWRNACSSTLGAKTSLYAEDLQITNEEQLCIYVCMYMFVSSGLMKTSLYRIELGL
ncbi:hypothetical protein H5410_031198, partial [Solanum commersonii]